MKEQDKHNKYFLSAPELMQTGNEL